MIKYEGDGQVVSQKYQRVIQISKKHIFVVVVAHSKNFSLFRIWGRFVKISFGCDGPQIIEGSSGDIWKNMILNVTQKRPFPERPCSSSIIAMALSIIVTRDTAMIRSIIGGLDVTSPKLVAV